jgi:ribonucleoside-diphosphate reductase alpha chain
VETTIQSDPTPSVSIPVPEQDHPRPHVTSPEAPEQRDLFARAHRRKLSDERKSITHKFSVGGHKGYLIVGLYEEGTPGEIFIKMSKEGSTLSGFMDGLALSISVGLQYGVPLKTLVDKLTNTRFDPSGFSENPSIRYASSVLDYIARWLGGRFLSPEYLKPRIAVGEREPNQSAAVMPSKAKDSEPADRGNGRASVSHAPSCTTCGMLMVPNGSCYKCVNCGSTSGCS